MYLYLLFNAVVCHIGPCVGGIYDPTVFIGVIVASSRNLSSEIHYPGFQYRSTSTDTGNARWRPLNRK
jgi:hypothetical protein